MEAGVFIGSAIIALVEIVKYLSPKVRGIATILVAIIVGGVVGAVDTYIGVPDVTIAEGITLALGSSGFIAALKKVSAGTILIGAPEKEL